jgi:elongation factor 1-beta
MARLVARIKILPAEAETDLDGVLESLKKGVPEGMEIKAHAKEPLAFGLHAIVGDFMLDDAEGQMDKLEDAIKGISGVGEIEVMNISRASVKMK